MLVIELRIVLLALVAALIGAALLLGWLQQRAHARARRESAALVEQLQLHEWQAEQQGEQRARKLLNDLAHEFRTPLATLLVHLEILKLTDISPETRQQSLQLMQVEGRRMSRLLHDLLELGQLEMAADVERRAVQLRALLDEALRELQSQAEARQIALVVRADDELPPVWGDRDRLKQVFLNLIDNAVKYSRAGDQVIISLQCDAERAQVECAVCDTGPVIAPEHLPHVTRRFYRAAPQASEGSGLGLALVEAILRRHQSQLQIESRTAGDERGTCVRFALPVWHDA